MTEILKVNAANPQTERIERAAVALRQGKLVAFPTETVYGLGANALDTQAVRRIFAAKGRPGSDPLIVHLADADWLPRVAAEIPPIAYRLAAAFWPGPLTLILPKRDEIPAQISAGRNTVGVRVPAHPVALALLKAAGIPIAAPSANRFGRTSPTRASHVLADLGERIDLILDGGETSIGIESTVLDITAPEPVILRPGGVTAEQLAALLGKVVVAGDVPEHEIPPSPGMLPRHYSPRAELIFLIQPERAAALAALRRLAEDEIGRGRRVGMLLVEEDLPYFAGLPVETASLGAQNDLWQAARLLYAGMHSLDARLVDVTLTRDLGEAGPGLALRDRLRRAATKIVS